ncbi:MAG: SPOR domain-containing protein [Candidatus Krumholzibacteriia bacterium]
MNEARLGRVPSAALAGAALLAGLLLAGAGCGGDEEMSDGLPAEGLVPGSVVTTDTTGTTGTAGTLIDPTAAADTAAQAAAPAPETLAPVPATTPRRDPPRTVDSARQAAPAGTFSLQLGSFRSLDNARGLGARVKALGYEPAVESAVVAGHTYHRVLLHGLADRSEASRTGERLRAELGITYLIRQSD